LRQSLECKGPEPRHRPLSARSIKARAKGGLRMGVARFANFSARLSQSQTSVQGRAGAARRPGSAADLKRRRDLLPQARQAKAVSSAPFVAAPLTPTRPSRCCRGGARGGFRPRRIRPPRARFLFLAWFWDRSGMTPAARDGALLRRSRDFPGLWAVCRLVGSRRSLGGRSAHRAHNRGEL
jgi:hypothetical protein